MKMTSALLQQTLSQLDAQAIPDNHPVLPQLQQIFGDHTFFLDMNGLSIVEPQGRARGVLLGTVFNLASWSDNNREHLVTHEPEPTQFKIILGRLH